VEEDAEGAGTGGSCGSGGSGACDTKLAAGMGGCCCNWCVGTALAGDGESSLAGAVVRTSGGRTGGMGGAAGESADRLGGRPRFAGAGTGAGAAEEEPVVRVSLVAYSVRASAILLMVPLVVAVFFLGGARVPVLLVVVTSGWEVPPTGVSSSTPGGAAAGDVVLRGAGTVLPEVCARREKCNCHIAHATG
jgi:hypothetical protein